MQRRWSQVSNILISSAASFCFIKLCNNCCALYFVIRTYVDAVINPTSGLGRLGVSYAGSPYDGDALDFLGFVPINSNYLVPLFLNINLFGLGYLFLPSISHPEICARRATATSTTTEIPTTSAIVTYSRFDGSLRSFGLRSQRCGGIFEQFGGSGSGRHSYRHRQAHVAWGYCCHHVPRQQSTDRARIRAQFEIVRQQQSDWSKRRNKTSKTPREYKQAVSYMLAHPYGFAQVMSSYYFDNSDLGPPQNED